MRMHQNWFSRLAFLILSMALLYLYQFMLRSQYVILTGTFGTIQTAVGAVLLSAFIALLILLLRRFRIRGFHLSAQLENWIAWPVLAVGLIVRLIYAKQMVLEPASDFSRYNIVAEYIVNGTLQTEGSHYCDYIALFPGTIGTSVWLAAVYRLFGLGNLFAAQAANAVLAAASCFHVWRATRRMNGAGAGLIALLLTAFFPSQILFSNGLASEFPFVYLLTLCLWLFAILLDQIKHRNLKVSLLLAAAIGIITAINQNIRSTSGIMLIACIICLLSLRCGENILRKWKRFAGVILAGVMTVSFMVTSSACTAGIEKLVDRQVAGGVKKVGWYLYLGMNRDSVGSYNLEDVAFWNEASEGKTPEEAHEICFNAAIERAFSDVWSLPRLLVGKFEILWGDDGYACDYNIIHKTNQGTLTPAADHFLHSTRILCSIYYFVMLCFSGLYVIQCWKKRILDIGYLSVLIWLGTMAAHLVLEVAPRYHYHVLSFMPIMAAISLSRLWKPKQNE